jgi:hypothetical protein
MTKERIEEITEIINDSEYQKRLNIIRNQEISRVDNFIICKLNELEFMYLARNHVRGRHYTKESPADRAKKAVNECLKHFKDLTEEEKIQALRWLKLCGLDFKH